MTFFRIGSHAQANEVLNVPNHELRNQAINFVTHHHGAPTYKCRDFPLPQVDEPATYEFRTTEKGKWFLVFQPHDKIEDIHNPISEQTATPGLSQLVQDSSVEESKDRISEQTRE